MTNNNAYDRVTERILDLMQKGVCPWRQPWSTKIEPPQNFATHRRYSGMNFFMLSMSGYQSPYFLTFRQIQELGGSIRKGSHGFPIVFWSTSEVETSRDTVNESPEPFVDPNKGKVKLVPFLKSYVVFNAEQIENIAFPSLPGASERPVNPIARAEEIIRDWKDAPETLHGFPKAYYRPDNDKIYLPSMKDFDRPEDYYCTRFHEMGHATGAPQRLNRQIRNHFGNEAYSREELVAEMTSAFLCAQCGIDNVVIENQAAYLSGWTKAISDDHRLIVTAASNAQRAANYIQGITKEAPTVDRAKALAQEMEVKEMARDIAKERRPDYGKDMAEEKEMTMTMD
jgi:antirestriction protein ArdC